MAAASTMVNSTFAMGHSPLIVEKVISKAPASACGKDHLCQKGTLFTINIAHFKDLLSKDKTIANIARVSEREQNQASLALAPIHSNPTQENLEIMGANTSGSENLNPTIEKLIYNLIAEVCEKYTDDNIQFKVVFRSNFGHDEAISYDIAICLGVNNGVAKLGEELHHLWISESNPNTLNKKNIAFLKASNLNENSHRLIFELKDIQTGVARNEKGTPIPYKKGTKLEYRIEGLL